GTRDEGRSAMTLARPRVYLILAAFLVAFFLLLHALGLRDNVSILSGDEPASGFLGAAELLYVAAWLVAALAAPVFAIAALIDALISASFRRGRARARGGST